MSERPPRLTCSRYFHGIFFGILLWCPTGLKFTTSPGLSAGPTDCLQVSPRVYYLRMRWLLITSPPPPRVSTTPTAQTNQRSHVSLSGFRFAHSPLITQPPHLTRLLSDSHIILTTSIPTPLYALALLLTPLLTRHHLPISECPPVLVNEKKSNFSFPL